MSTEELLSQLTSRIGELVVALKTNREESSGAKNTVSRPDVFKTGATDARRFLAYFTMWARSQGPPLNQNIGGAMVMQDEHWIQSALSLLSGEAAVWASTYINCIEAHHRDTANPKTALFPFDGSWAEFVKQFQTRFLTADDAVAAQRELSNCTQGSDSVANYAGKFQQIAERTRYSDEDKMARFYDGLSSKAKDLMNLASVLKEPKTLAETIETAVKLEFKMRKNPNTQQSAPSQPRAPAKDPYAMEIDASRPGPSGKSREDFFQVMRSHCFGCGGKGHSKSQCNRKDVNCRYCARRGHNDSICQDRYLGLEKNRGANRSQRVATGTTEENFSLFSDSTSTSSNRTDSTSISSTRTNSQIEAELKETNRLLALALRPDEKPQSF
jgi:hypothetical protein